MNKKLFEILHNWPKAYISGTDLHHILDKSPDSRHAIIKRAMNFGDLISIRRDLYLVKKQSQSLTDSFEVAPIIYGPSYISFESALGYHGWIPEAVRTITCATVKRSKEFKTAIGIFSFEHIPIETFSIGVEQIPQKGFTLFIASPIKAIADMIYSRKRIWKTIEDLSEDLRIEPENLKNSDIQDFIENYPIVRVKKSLSLLCKKD